MAHHEAHVGGLTLGGLVDLVLDRAESPETARDQLAGLIAATQAISADLDLPTALSTLASVACDLVGARYAAIGVISPDGLLEQFIHVGLTEEQIAALGDLPTGHGILGAVIRDREPIRLADLASDERSAGFPAGHPPMKDFLGVPIRVGGTIYGNLYLTGSAKGAFDDSDEQVIVTLASLAGTTIANARLYAESKLGHRWLSASEEINQRLLSGDIADTDVSFVAELVLALSDASFLSVTLPNGEDGPAVSLQFGPLADAADFAPDRTLGTTMVLPWADPRTKAPGEMVVAREANAHPFTAADIEMTERFARSVAIARELGSARSDREFVALADERDRIARDLHDHVIQSLFAVGLSIQSIVGSTTGVLAARLATQVDAIDVTIRQIRQTIFQLGSTPTAAAYSQKARLNQLVRTTLEGEGIDSSLDFSGPVDTLIDSELGDEVSAVLREALSNVVRHAEASRVDISVAVSTEQVRVVVTDNGRGLGELAHRSGLANLAARAKQRGGTFTIAARAPSGTTLDWSVPV